MRVYNLLAMATYAKIQQCVKQHFGFVPKTCWIAHIKELNGLKPRMAHNRENSEHRKVPCPANRRLAIENCFKRLKMI
jgi:hypothetical protein